MIKAALVDISGVIHVDYQLLPNAIEGWKKLNELLKGQVSLLTNTDNVSLATLFSTLCKIGFKDILRPDQVRRNYQIISR